MSRLTELPCPLQFSSRLVPDVSRPTPCPHGFPVTNALFRSPCVQRKAFFWLLSKSKARFLRGRHRAIGNMAFPLRLPCSDPELSNLPAIECAERTIRHLALRAFRTGSLAESDVQNLLRPFQTSLNAGNSFPAALSLSVQAVSDRPSLSVSSRIIDSSPDVDDFEFASRLSYFLWASLPDDELLDLAARRALVNSPTTIRAQVTRLLADPRADAMVDAFADGWFGFSSLKNHVVDPGTFPAFDEELRQAMLVETRTFLQDFFSENRPISDLIASQTLYSMNGWRVITVSEIFVVRSFYESSRRPTSEAGCSPRAAS